MASLKRGASLTAYEILGVSCSANLAEIKSRYRVLVLKFHPDVDGSDEAKTKFAAIKTSYEHLSTESARAAYDRKMHTDMRDNAAAWEADDDGAYDPHAHPRPPRRPRTSTLRQDWWTQSDTMEEVARQQLEQLRLEKRRQMEAKSSTFRWPTGESFDKMDDHQKYFYYRMTRRHFSSSSSSSRVLPPTKY